MPIALSEGIPREGFRFGHQRQTGFNESFCQNHAIELRPRFHDQCEVLLDLRKPGEVGLRIEQPRSHAELVDAIPDRD